MQEVQSTHSTGQATTAGRGTIGRGIEGRGIIGRSTEDSTGLTTEIIPIIVIINTLSTISTKRLRICIY